MEQVIEQFKNLPKNFYGEVIVKFQNGKPYHLFITKSVKIEEKNLLEEPRG